MRSMNRFCVTLLLLLAKTVLSQLCPPPTTGPPLKHPIQQNTQGFPPLDDLVLKEDATELVQLRYPSEPSSLDEYANCPHLDTSSVVLWSTLNITSGGVVNLPQGKRILICGDMELGTDASPLGIINIPSTSELVFGDNDMSLHVTGLRVLGSIRMGSKTCRLRSNIQVTFHGTPETASNSTIPLAHKGMYVEAGGQLEIHGARYFPTWTHLAYSASPGDTVVYVQDAVNWEPGQNIVVVTSHLKDSLDFQQNEQVTIVDVKVDERGLSAVSITPALEFNHFGGPDYQVEVGLLSRRIKLQGSASSDPPSLDESQCSVPDTRYTSVPCTEKLMGGYGGHITITDFGSKGQVRGVELYRMGKTNQVGKYPIHFYRIGIGSSITDSSIHKSYFRCAGVHATNGTLIAENVGFDVTGHCFYLAHVHFLGPPPVSSGQTLPLVRSDVSGLVQPSDSIASGFYITNAGNTFVGNAASGGYSGFTIVRLPKAVGSSSSWTGVPEFSPFIEFDGNSCHSSGWWWDRAGCIYVGGMLEHEDDDSTKNLVFQPGRTQPARNTKCEDGSNCALEFTNTKVFLSTWGFNNWGKRSVIDKYEVHDVQLSAGLLGEHAIRNMLIVCRSSQHTPEKESNWKSYERRFWDAAWFAYEYYDTGQFHILSGLIVRNCGTSRQYPVWQFRTHSDRYVPELMQVTNNVQYDNSNTNGFLIKLSELNKGTISARYANWYDADGSASLRSKPTLIGSSVDGSGKWWELDSNCTQLGRSNMVACDLESRTGNKRTVGTFKLTHLANQDELLRTGKFCGNGNENVDCPTLAYITHFGTPGKDFLSNSLQLSYNPQVTGPIGGFGWYVYFKQGSLSRIDIAEISIPLGGLMFALSYPSRSKFRIKYAIRNCSESPESELCQTSFQSANSVQQVANGRGNLYFFDESTLHLYVKIVEQQGTLLEWDPEKRMAKLDSFDKFGLRIPKRSFNSFISIRASCVDELGRVVPVPDFDAVEEYDTDEMFEVCGKTIARVPRYNNCPQGSLQVGFDECDVDYRQDALDSFPWEEVAIGSGGAAGLILLALLVTTFKRRKQNKHFKKKSTYYQPKPGKFAEEPFGSSSSFNSVELHRESSGLLASPVSSRERSKNNGLSKLSPMSSTSSNSSNNEAVTAKPVVTERKWSVTASVPFRAHSKESLNTEIKLQPNVGDLVRSSSSLSVKRTPSQKVVLTSTLPASSSGSKKTKSGAKSKTKESTKTKKKKKIKKTTSTLIPPPPPPPPRREELPGDWVPGNKVQRVKVDMGNSEY